MQPSFYLDLSNEIRKTTTLSSLLCSATNIDQIIYCVPIFFILFFFFKSQMYLLPINFHPNFHPLLKVINYQENSRWPTKIGNFRTEQRNTKSYYMPTSWPNLFTRNKTTTTQIPCWLRDHKIPAQRWSGPPITGRPVNRLAYPTPELHTQSQSPTLKSQNADHRNISLVF